MKNVARVFSHHTWKLCLKDFYHHPYQLFMRETELSGQKMTKMLHTCRCVRIFHCDTPWCPIKLQRNILREYHTIIPVHLWNKVWSNDAYAPIVACNLGPSKQKRFTKIFAWSLKVVLKAKQSNCDHCELQPVLNGSCCVWWRFKKWSGPRWAMLMLKFLILKT